MVSKRNTKEGVPKAHEKGQIQQRKEKNYISGNMKSVIFEMQPKQVQPKNEVAGKQLHKNFGKIPKYINNYKNDAEEYKQRLIQEEEDAKIPPGCRLMGEDERRKTLEELQISKKEVNNTLERLPLGSSSLVMQKRKRELEAQLLRIERSIETFSKKTVYIAY